MRDSAYCRSCLLHPPPLKLSGVIRSEYGTAVVILFPLAKAFTLPWTTASKDTTRHFVSCQMLHANSPIILKSGSMATFSSPAIYATDDLTAPHDKPHGLTFLFLHLLSSIPLLALCVAHPDPPSLMVTSKCYLNCMNVSLPVC